MHTPPITYVVDGEPYVAFPDGSRTWINGFAPELRDGKRGHLLLVFALP